MEATKGSELDWVSDKDSNGIRHVKSLQGNGNITKLRQPIVFIVGAFRDVDPIRQRHNILKACKLARRYWNDGWAVVCPHLNGGFFDGDVDDGLLLPGHQVIMLKCDLVAVVKDKRLDSSTGSRDELELADAAGIQIVYEEVRL